MGAVKVSTSSVSSADARTAGAARRGTRRGARATEEAEDKRRLVDERGHKLVGMSYGRGRATRMRRRRAHEPGVALEEEDARVVLARACAWRRRL